MKFKLFNKTIIDANRIIDKTTIAVINYFHDNNLILAKNKDFNKIFYHYLSLNLIPLKTPQDDNFLYISHPLISKSNELLDIIDLNILNSFYISQLKKCSKLFNIRLVWYNNIKFDDLSPMDPEFIRILQPKTFS